MSRCARCGAFDVDYWIRRLWPLCKSRAILNWGTVPSTVTASPTHLNASTPSHWDAFTLKWLRRNGPMWKKTWLKSIWHANKLHQTHTNALFFLYFSGLPVEILLAGKLKLGLHSMSSAQTIPLQGQGVSEVKPLLSFCLPPTPPELCWGMYRQQECLNESQRKSVWANHGPGGHTWPVKFCFYLAL